MILARCGLQRTGHEHQPTDQFAVPRCQPRWPIMAPSEWPTTTGRSSRKCRIRPAMSSAKSAGRQSSRSGLRSAMAAQIRHNQPAAGQMRRQQRKAAAGVGEAMDQQQGRLGAGNFDVGHGEATDIDHALAASPGVLLARPPQSSGIHRPSFSFTAARPGLPSKVVTPASQASRRPLFRRDRLQCPPLPASCRH